MAALRLRGVGLLASHPDSAPPSVIVTALRVDGRRGFVVSDMSDVDEFVPIPSVDLPAAPVYLIRDLDRGDAMAKWSPDEALPCHRGIGPNAAHRERGTALAPAATRGVGTWALFHAIGSRRRKLDGSLDARTPALWFSNGTGRDGPANRNEPKVGWCWAGNRHTWLGFASAACRDSTPE